MTANPTIERPLQASLFELAINSDNPPLLAKFYATALGYQFTETAGTLRGTALERRLQIRPGKNRTLAYTAYRIEDEESMIALQRRLTQAHAKFDLISHDGFTFPAVEVCDPDGNRFVFGLANATCNSIQGSIAHRPARIQHIVFTSVNVQRLLSFWSDILGFTLTDRVVDHQGCLRAAFLRCNREHHSVAVFAANESRLDHHCYEVENWNLIRDWADHFANHGIPLQWGPGRHGPGNNLFLFIHDPDGNWIEISAELEQVDPDRPVGTWPHEERTLNSWGVAPLRS